MVASNTKRIRCLVVSVPVESEPWVSRGVLAHEMVPGADPYVAQLIKRLQDEVRHERQAEALLERAGTLVATRSRFESRQLIDELEIPWFDMPYDDDPMGDGEERSPEWSDGNDDVAPAV